MDQGSARNLELEAAAFADFDNLDSWRVFADWLLSHGDARGEIANLAVHAGDAFLSERKHMAHRMAELERPFIDDWHAWAQDHDLLDVEATFKRGFVFAIKGSLTQLLPMIDEVFERDPIQRLTLTDVDADSLVALLERQPAWMGRLRYLKLVGEVGESGAAALSTVPLPELRRLNLLGTELDSDACPHLARLQTSQLEQLTLTSNEIDRRGVRELLRSPTRGQWLDLYLSGNPIDGEAVAEIAADTGLVALRGLYMRQVDAKLSDFAVYADPSKIPTLERLEVPGYGHWRHRDVLDRLRERFGQGLVLC